MNNSKILLVRLELKLEITNPFYGLEDLIGLINIFNDIHSQGCRIVILDKIILRK